MASTRPILHGRREQDVTVELSVHPLSIHLRRTPIRHAAGARVDVLASLRRPCIFRWRKDSDQSRIPDLRHRAFVPAVSAGSPHPFILVGSIFHQDLRLNGRLNEVRMLFEFRRACSSGQVIERDWPRVSASGSRIAGEGCGKRQGLRYHYTETSPPYCRMDPRARA